MAPSLTTFTFCADGGVLGYIQLFLLAVPFIVGVLFSLIRQSRLNDITIVLFSLGFGVNSVLNTQLRAFIARDRPYPGVCGEGFGMPAHEPQLLSCYIMLDIMFSYMCDRYIDPVHTLLLLLVSTVSTATYVYVGYYTPLQALAGVALGAVVGVTIVNFVCDTLSPFMPAGVHWWNGVCARYRFVPSRLRLAHRYHWHPRRPCSEPACDCNATGTLCAIPSPLAHAYLYGMLFHLTFHIAFHLLVYTFIHFRHFV